MVHTRSVTLIFGPGQVRKTFIDFDVPGIVFFTMTGESKKKMLLFFLDDVTMTHDHCGRTTQRTNGALTHRVSSTGAPHSDGTLNNVVRIKIRS